MTKDRFGELLNESLKDYEQDIDIFKNMEIIPQEEMLSKVYKKVQKQKDEKLTSKINKTIAKNIKVVASILIISLFFSLCLESQKVNAFRFQIRKSFVEVKKNFTNIFYTKDRTNEVVVSNEDNNEIINHYQVFVKMSRRI